MKTALIFGISGQDGAYLSKLLLEKNYKLVGVSRDAQTNSFQNLRALGIFDKITTRSASLRDFSAILECLKQVNPDEIYNLSGQSSVGLSFEQPTETFESILLGALNLLEAIRFLRRPVKLFSSCSSECFGDLSAPASEATAFNPRSPYGIAKAASYWTMKNYRESYGLYACSGILFNHESPLRPERFVTKKIVSAAIRIAQGSKEKLAVGNIKVKRDWGWAPEYVDGMHRILQQDKPDDFVLATGRSHSLEEFIGFTFTHLDLKWQDHVTVNEALMRPLDIHESVGNPAKAEKILGWKASTTLEQIIERMVEAGKK